MSFRSRTYLLRAEVICSAFAVAAILVAPVAQAAKLTLGNGDQISGDIVSLQGELLTLNRRRLAAPHHH